MTKMNDYINQIKDEKIERAIEIDSAKKMKELIKGEKIMKRNSFNFWKWGALAFASIGVCALGINYIQNNDINRILKPKEVEKSTNKYLSVNYGLMAYKSANEYIDKNIDLTSLETGKSVNISSDDLDIDNSSEYKYCKSNIEVKKTKFGLYEYNVESSCDNESNGSVKLAIKVYSNMLGLAKNIKTDFGENDKEFYIDLETMEKYYSIHNLEETDFGYNANISYPVGRVSETSVQFDKNFNILNLKTFDTNNYFNTLSATEDNLFAEIDDCTFAYYDNNFKEIWKKNYCDNSNNRVLYDYIKEEKNRYILLENIINNNNKIWQVISIDKSNGNKNILFTLDDFIHRYDKSSDVIYTYTDERFSDKNNYIIKKYNLKGELVDTTDLNKYIDSKINYGAVDIYVSNNNYYLLGTDLNTNLIIRIVNNKDGSSKDIICDNKESLNIDTYCDFKLLDDGFEISYAKTTRQIAFDKYDKNNNLIYTERVDLNKGHNLNY